MLKALGASSQARQSFEKAWAEAEKLTPRERMQRRVDRYNATPGDLNKDGDYNCPLCMNRGNTAVLDERGGVFYDVYPPCRCMEIRKSIWRLKQSGLEKSIRENTFERFEIKEPWQKVMVETAKLYLADGEPAGRWFFAGGQPGCGKTHICTAIARKLLYEKPVLYVVWEQVSKQIKAVVTDAEEYAREVGKLENVDVLYIDDLFKPVKDEFGNRRPPSPADMKLAFEVINHRYINRLPTIISSEWYLSELIDMDEATASRIAERSDGFCLTLGRDKNKNHRYISDNVL